ncbi:MAG: DNA polymerase III subunit alpha, partial [Pantoea sp.]|nr:DNA polymerase III subunit alpha [Pantoea sp.]
GRQDEESYLHAAVELAIAEGVPVVATNEVCFINEEDFDAHEIRVAIHDGYTLDDPKRPRNYSPQQYMRSEAEMCELFSDIPEALENSVEIAKRCNVTVRLGEYFLPQFPTGDMTTEDYLVVKSREGLEERLAFLFPDEAERAEKRPEYDERLEIELNVINQMGFPGYFLIVMEFIQWSKDNGVPVGPGRGSGAGSLVAYALKITDIDPLEFDLLFERFLNPERVSMPDFDVDFCMEKRDQVIEHVADMYGREAVSQIITFGTMAAKAVIRDVGRVLGHPYGFVDRISKLIPPDPGMTLEKAFIAEPQLPAMYDADEEVKALIDMARKLEGVTRNAGKHAGGVVIAPTKITDFAPLYCDENGQFPVTQFDKNDVEYAGLVKFDFLGLRTLTIIDWALKMINPRREKQGLEPIDIAAIPLDDKKSFNMLQRSETTAVFQLESRGMKDLIKRLKPDCFEDMIALVALFRPGPLQSGMVDNFIDRKHGREAISYPDIQW